MTYLGIEFNSIEEIKAFSKQGAIDFYKKLAKRFNANPTMEASVAMSDYAEVLNKRFGLSYVEIEEIELSIY